MYGCAGVTLAVMLVIAVTLEPDLSGRGTHRRLGLPPCSFLQAFGSPCPSCGMTTAWAHVVRGQWLMAVEANVGGALLAMSALGFVPWCLAAAVRGRYAVVRFDDRWVVGLATAWIVITLVDWGRRIWLG